MANLALSVGCLIPLKNLSFFVHQNCLILCDLLLRRLPAESSGNIWTKQLRSLVATKRVSGVSEGTTGMGQNSRTIQQLIRHICGCVRAGARKDAGELPPSQSRDVVSPMLNCVGNLMVQLDRCSISQAREFLAKALVLFYWLQLAVDPDRRVSPATWRQGRDRAAAHRGAALPTAAARREG